MFISSILSATYSLFLYSRGKRCICTFQYTYVIMFKSTYVKFSLSLLKQSFYPHAPCLFRDFTVYALGKRPKILIRISNLQLQSRPPFLMHSLYILPFRIGIYIVHFLFLRSTLLLFVHRI